MWLPCAGEVDFVGDEKARCLLILSEHLVPRLDVFQCRGFGNIIHKHHTVRVLQVRWYQTSIPFLSRRIPHLQPIVLSILIYILDIKIDAHSRLDLIIDRLHDSPTGRRCWCSVRWCWSCLHPGRLGRRCDTFGCCVCLTRKLCSFIIFYLSIAYLFHTLYLLVRWLIDYCLLDSCFFKN